MYIYIYIYIYISISIYLSIYISIYLSIYLYLSLNNNNNTLYSTTSHLRLGPREALPPQRHDDTPTRGTEVRQIPRPAASRRVIHSSNSNSSYSNHSINLCSALVRG